MIMPNFKKWEVQVILVYTGTYWYIPIHTGTNIIGWSSTNTFHLNHALSLSDSNASPLHSWLVPWAQSPSSGQCPQLSDHQGMACSAQINRFNSMYKYWYAVARTSMYWYGIYQLGCGPPCAWACSPICCTYWRTYQYILVWTSTYSIYCSMNWNVSFLWLLVLFSACTTYILTMHSVVLPCLRELP